MLRSDAQTKTFCFAAFSLIYLTLGIHSYQKKSATFDEPVHMASAYAQVVLDDHRIDPTHPPLLRLWAGLPMWFDKESLSFNQESDAWKNFNQWRFAAEFLYRDNDAREVLAQSRFMMLLLGLVLAAFLYLWAMDIGGFRMGLFALGLYLFEPNMFAHARLVTTDFGFALSVFATAYFLWRVLGHMTLANTLGFSLAMTCTLLSKFSGVLLVPFVCVFLLWRFCSSSLWTSTLFHDANRFVAKGVKTTAIIFIALTVAVVGIWAAYGWHYLPSADENSDLVFKTLERSRQVAPLVSSLVESMDRLQLLPNAFSQGFLSIVASSSVERETYMLGLSGVGSSVFYFPLAFLVKTPVTLLLLFFVGVVLMCAKWKNLMRYEYICLGVIALFFGTALSSKLNIGVRHILVVYPFVIMIALGPLQKLCLKGHKHWAVVFVLLAGLEFGVSYPHPLSFFNAVAGGPSSGHHYLADSNLDWGQDLPALKAWMDKNKVESLNLSYFGSAEPSYYKINAYYMPGIRVDGLEKPLAPAKIPGWLALSATNLLVEEYTDGFYAPLKNRKPDHILNHTIYLYWIEQPWWPTHGE